MATSRRSIIVDSSALVALLIFGDAHHQKSVSILDDTNPTETQLLLPSEVLSETLNIIGKKYGRLTAVESGNELLAFVEGARMNLISATVAILQPAFALQITATGGPSFIDCLVMALADEHHTPYVFGFDETFRKNGYLLP